MELCEESVRIPVGGERYLSARLWRPSGPGRWPAIIDASPYRCGDIFRPLVEAQLPYFAARGYAALAIDIAGSGNSPGVLRDEYEPLEIDDLIAVIGWVAAQSWCDGGVGLSGFSWAAFAALRASAKRPAALKAMVLGGVSEDGWRTDIHYLGGALYTGQIDWSGVMLMFNALPPDPSQFGGDWRAEWKARLHANAPWIVRWLSHPAHDGYWTDRAADLSQPGVPLLLYAGLADKYATSVLRVAAQWRGTVRTIIGPWEHAPPYAAARGPRIGFLQEALRWWDAFLKGRETGVLDDPPLRLWMGEPATDGTLAKGTWISADWPADSGPALRLVLRGAKLVENAPVDAGAIVLHPVRANPETLSADLYEDAPAAFDVQRARDLGAYVAESEPFQADAILFPSSHVACHVEEPSGTLLLRLIDIAPDGAAMRLSTGAENLANRAARDIRVPLQACAWRLKKGHRLALAVSADGWPAFWPSRDQHPLTLTDLVLSVPLARPRATVPAFAAPESAAAARPEKLKWLDVAGETLPPADAGSVSLATTSAAHHLSGTDYLITSRFDVMPLGDANARAVKSYRVAFERPGWSIRIETRLEVSSTHDAFHVAWKIRAREGDVLFHEAARTASVPRHSV